MTNTTLNAVFVASKAQGKSTATVVNAVKTAIANDWNNAKLVQDVANAYKTGRVVASLALKSENAALAILALKPHKDGASDGHRTFGQHMACRAAISAWSTIKLLAGAPNGRTGAKRAPRQQNAADKASDGSKLPDNLLPAITRATSHADVLAYALRMASNISKYVNLNAAMVSGDVGDVLRAFPASVKKAVKAGKPAAEAA